MIKDWWKKRRVLQFDNRNKISQVFLDMKNVILYKCMSKKKNILRSNIANDDEIGTGYHHYQEKKKSDSVIDTEKKG